MKKAALILIFCSGIAYGQETEKKTEETSTTTSTTDLTSEVKTTTKRRRLRRSRIQELERYHKERKGKNIFGLGLLGFHANLDFGSLEGSTSAGAPSDDFSGIGMGILFDIQLAGGSTNSIGIRTSGQWYWRWGVRVHLDFFRNSNEANDQKREINEVLSSAVVKYYFPMDEYSFSRGIIVLNRFHFFLGVGPMWSVALNDTIENLSDRTFTRGPTQSDFFLAMEVGFNARITRQTYFSFDFRFGLNLSPSINDDLSGKEIANGSGTNMGFHAGFAFAF